MQKKEEEILSPAQKGFLQRPGSKGGAAHLPAQPLRGGGRAQRDAAHLPAQPLRGQGSKGRGPPARTPGPLRGAGRREFSKKQRKPPAPQEKAGGLEATSPRPVQKSAQPVRRKPLRASQKQSNPLLFGCGGAARAGRGRKLLPLFPITEKRFGAASASKPFFLFSFRFRRFLRRLAFQKAARARSSPASAEGAAFRTRALPGAPPVCPIDRGRPGPAPSPAPPAPFCQKAGASRAGAQPL